MVTVKNLTTFTAMRAGAERLLHSSPTVTTILRGVLRCYRDGSFAKDAPVVFEVAPKLRPRSVGDTFSQVVILEHVFNLKVLVGHEVCRHHYASRCLNSKIFTLASYLKVFMCKFHSGSTAVTRAFLLTAHLPGRLFKLLLCFSQKARILNLDAVRVGIKRLEANVQTDSFTRRLSVLVPVNVDRKLHIVPVTFLNQPYPFNQVDRIQSEVVCPLEFQSPDVKAVGEGDALVQCRKFPARMLVLNAPHVFLETRVADWLNAFFAVVVEAADSSPRALP